MAQLEVVVLCEWLCAAEVCSHHATMRWMSGAATTNTAHTTHLQKVLKLVGCSSRLCGALGRPRMYSAYTPPLLPLPKLRPTMTASMASWEQHMHGSEGGTRTMLVGRVCRSVPRTKHIIYVRRVILRACAYTMSYQSWQAAVQQHACPQRLKMQA